MTSAHENLETKSQFEVSQSEVADFSEDNIKEAAQVPAKEDTSTEISNSDQTVFNRMISTLSSRPVLANWVIPVSVGYFACAIPSLFSLIGRLVQHLYPIESTAIKTLQDFVLVNLHSSFHISVLILMHGPVLALVLINLWALRRTSSRSKLSEFALVMVVLFFSTVLQMFMAFNWNPPAFGWVYFLRTILKDYALIAPPALSALFARELLIMKAANLCPIKSASVERLETINKNS